MQEKFRDKTRDGLTDALNALGARAEMAERGRSEERVGSSWAQSLGVIDVADCPVRWINVVRQSNQYGSRWWLVFGAPDEPSDLRSAERNKDVQLKTSRKRSFPLFGRVTEAGWTDNGNAGDLATTLANDRAVDAFVWNVSDVEIRNDDENFRGWTLRVGKRFTPSKRDWDAICAMAEHLLAFTRR